MGLEVHAQVNSNAKLFSGAAVGFGAGRTSRSAWSTPGCRACCRCSTSSASSRPCARASASRRRSIEFSRFDRKNYFYPDLPSGYQISQFEHPIVGEGEIEVEHDDGSPFEVRIERLHLEQDAGKSIHDLDPDSTYRRPEPFRHGPDGNRVASRTCVRRRRPRTTSRSCARSWSIWAPATATWRRASARRRQRLRAPAGRRARARAARSRTSTRSAS
jgi:Asp-tRNA(Asn)/Glu-tRNA(Gln) amidotransferase B subunit